MTATPEPPIVRFQNVTKRFSDGNIALKDVSFTVENAPKVGEFIAMLGPSGCGKSTILRLIAGLRPHFPASSGTVEVMGKPVEGPGSDRGMVFQDYTSFDNRTVLDNVAFGLECSGVSAKERQSRAKEWIGKVGLDVARDADKYPHQLSGGMRQRVAIARTLILQPKIILMDEPFGALDPVTRLNMQDLLVTLWRELEATVFFVTHSVEEAVYLGDRVYILSPAPGTLLKEMSLPGPDRPARVMQREAAFNQVVFEIRDIIEKLEAIAHPGAGESMSTPPNLPPAKSAGLAEYLKRAFLFRWNLLAFAGGVTAAILSPFGTDAVLALVAASELVYLTLLVSSPKFRSAIDAAVYQEGRQTSEVTGQRSIQDLLGGLSMESKRRFETLRSRCLEMRAIAQGVRGRTGAQSSEDLNTAALDRLLWVFLRLLVSQEALLQFLNRTDIKDIMVRLEDARARLDAQKEGDERMVRSLQDSVAAHEMRLENYQRAQKNSEFVRIELDRIEAKIQALTEASVNRQDPDFLSGQIDSVSESMQSTEKAISELQQLTGLVDEMQEPPPILSADLPRVVQR